MGGIKLFLESSTIHGLTYISTEKKISKLLWIFIVIAGFSTAGLLILQSFKSWAESPVSTTLETLPVSEVPLPRVTVCPPQNTFTNLNFDLTKLYNKTNKETKIQILNFTMGIIQEVLYEEYIKNISVLNETNRFKNWYNGYTLIKIPKYSMTDKFLYELDTIATSGTISTTNFEETTKADFIPKQFKLRVKVDIPDPDYISSNDMVTLHFNIDKITVSLSKRSQGYDSLYFIQNGMDRGDEVEERETYTNFTPPNPTATFRQIELDRNIFSEDLLTSTYKMPGFKLSWFYSGIEVSSQPYGSDYGNQENLKFKRRSNNL